MKKITMMLSLLVCIPMMMAQTTEVSAIQQELTQAANMESQEPVDVQSLIATLESRGDSPLISDVHFTLEERLALRKYYSDQTRNVLADIIPTAGATETFPVAVGDNFFDPGGPGGSSTGGTPGNYPNCGCITLTTLDGATEIEFLFFSVFATFDWLRIYDGVDTTGPVLYDNSAGGINDGDITLVDMIASNGSALFTGTSGSLTFEFNATAVVDYGGWDVEILATSGGGPATEFFANDIFPAVSPYPFGTIPIAGPYGLTPIGSTVPTIFADDIDGSGTMYALDFDNTELVIIDTATGAATSVGPLTGLLAGHFPEGISLDPTTGTMYALSTDGATTQLYTVDTTTGTLTPVGAGTGNSLGIWLEIDNSGVGYMADVGDDNLYSVDLSTGVGTLIGPLGVDINFVQEATVDPTTDILYAGIYDGANTVISTVDKNTGAATPLGISGAYEQGILSVNATPVVGNNTCANATTINCGQTLSGDTGNDTDTNGDGSPDEWFAVTSSVAGELITVSTCDQAAFDTILTVYDACGGTVVETNDDGPGCSGFTSELSFVADGSSTYYIAVDGFGGASGTFDLTVTCGPVNDDPCGAIAIECGVPLFGNTDTANDDTAAAPDCDTPTSAPGVWYVYEDTTGLVTDILVSTCSTNTDYDTKISVYTGDCTVLPLTCVAGNDDSPNCTNFQSEVEFQSDGNTTYYILVHGFGGATGNFELNMTCTPVPPPNDMIVNSIDVDEIGVPYTDPAVAMPAATVENGNPVGCDISGGKGVWYNFTSAGNGTATAEIVSPAGNSFVVFFTAPDENAIETDLEYFFQIGNQCAPGTVANINTAAGSVYYVYVVNDGGITDITIDGTLLSTNDNVIEGFSFYPNPTNGTLNLDSLEAIEDVAIYNLLGQQVLGQEVNATSTQLDTSTLATGAYLMKVTVNGQTGTYKVIKR
ncbi:T9SS type A sorting domain-containing protein [Aureitalea sp. L0-47]|uniref:T9SS type A sorting domain-containing protein n=1 Tax=Aureitalea sp. L0-47 TaxID=2816962 RepID=UPI002238DE65|nr:T9SS type A sorting domain-containing protein [Aureitalea sp. L0-47]MCW5519642.1 T9SS type A sorting domain-containing protein [Aureitalea sp. L0-47]